MWILHEKSSGLQYCQDPVISVWNLLEKLIQGPTFFPRHTHTLCVPLKCLSQSYQFTIKYMSSSRSRLIRKQLYWQSVDKTDHYFFSLKSCLQIPSNVNSLPRSRAPDLIQRLSVWYKEIGYGFFMTTWQIVQISTCPTFLSFFFSGWT